MVSPEFARNLRNLDKTLSIYTDGRQETYKLMSVRVSRMNILTLPTLEDLRKQLRIPTINTGRQFSLTGPSGCVSDDMEGLHAVTDEKGRLRLQSGVEFSFFVYRGQTELHPTCTPRIARLKKNPPKQLLELCRSIAFEDVVESLPLVRISRSLQFLNCPLYIDAKGLAQHYDLCTDMLDCTSNFDVASFFATCCWNDDARRYEPLGFHDKPGVIYRLMPDLLMAANENGHDQYDVEIIGWQPLPRPEEQRAFAIRLAHGQDLHNLPTVQRFPFRHKKRVSRRIYNAFEQGRELFPDEPMAEISESAKGLYQFTRSQIDRAWSRLESWKVDTEGMMLQQQSEQEAGIEVVETASLSWAGMNVEQNEELLKSKLDDVCNRVRFRRACYPI